MDIDLVVCWVDGEDIEHIKLKNKYKALLGESVNKEAVIDARFKDNGELKYLLRSVEQNASFINNIYIITSNNQYPKWLNIQNKKIHLISDKDIMPENALPTFNSMAIEACIANIPNLSDRFLYANDDMFFAKPLTEKDFFNKDYYPIIRFKKNFHIDRKYNDLYNKCISTTLQKFYNVCKKQMPFFEHHNIDAYYKPDIQNCIERFKEDFQETIYSKFKNSSNIHRIIYSCYSYILGHSTIKNALVYKIPNFLRFIVKLYCKFNQDSTVISISEKDYNIKNYKMFCLNDDELATEDDRKRCQIFLEQMFPKKSSFEK